MRVRDIDVRKRGDFSVLSGAVAWEDTERTSDHIEFRASAADQRLPERDWGNAFLAACFPLAVFGQERRLVLEAAGCPMLMEGLATVHAWWSSWADRPLSLPEVATERRTPDRQQTSAPERGMACLSGGVDSLHMLLHNRRVYRPGDAAYIRQAIFIHGFDIGRRPRDLQEDRFAVAEARLRALAESVRLELVICYTNLRHRPLPAGFWLHRYNGAALAAAAHAALPHSGMLFIAATSDIAHLTPLGSHPMTDPLYSSQRLRIVHEGARFTRLQKIRDLIEWPEALENLRVCADAHGPVLNCGVCEKCLRTKIALSAVGCTEAPAFGSTSVAPEQAATIEISNALQAAHYRELVRPLEARGLSDLARAVMERLKAYSEMRIHQADWTQESWAAG